MWQRKEALMPTNHPQKPEEPKWQPEEDPPVRQAEEDLVNAGWAAVAGTVIFVPITFFTVPEMLAENSETFQLGALAFMTYSAWILTGRL